MKWALILVILFNGHVAAFQIPMADESACRDAATDFLLKHNNNRYGVDAVCVRTVTP